MSFRTTFAAALVAASLSVSAHAELLEYVLTGPVQATFFVDSHPQPDVYADYPFAQNFEIYGVSGSYPFLRRPTPSFFNLKFYGSVNNGCIDIISADYDPLLNMYVDNYTITLTTSGPQIFDGTVEDPTLKTGTFQIVDFLGVQTHTLTVTAVNAVTAVPEPATWGLMVAGLGLMGVAGVQRRQRRDTADAEA